MPAGPESLVMVACHVRADVIRVKCPAMRTLSLTIALSLIFGCQKRAPEDGSPVLAQVGSDAITAKDLESRIVFLGRSKFLFDHYSKPEKKKELLNGLIESEALFQEARRLGYDRDPAVKRDIVNRMLQNEVDTQVKIEGISDADIEKYYKDHPGEFVRPDQVRVTQIVVKDRARALKVAAEAKAMPKGKPDALPALVAKYTEDESVARSRGGDLGIIDRNVTSLPKPVVEAALALQQTFDVSDPVQTEHGFAILVLTQRQPGYSKSLADARSSIQSRLLYERRQQKRTALTSEIRQRAKIQIDEAKLAAVTFPLSGTGTAVTTSAPKLVPPPGAPQPSTPPPPRP
jgi:peptidyl-prolyl cis-trans isomerase C